MDKEEFRNNHPNMCDAIRSRMHVEEIYGIRFKSHNWEMRQYEFTEREERSRAFFMMKFNPKPGTVEGFLFREFNQN